ncbi:MAG: hypothetical protein ACLFVI_07950 [Archaeoglobaceae archaeon]
MPKTIKISDSSYSTLNKIAGELRAREGRPVSVEEVINILIKKSRFNPTDFAGGWDMDDDELDSILKSLRDKWSAWKIE